MVGNLLDPKMGLTQALVCEIKTYKDSSRTNDFRLQLPLQNTEQRLKRTDTQEPVLACA